MVQTEVIANIVHTYFRVLLKGTLDWLSLKVNGLIDKESLLTKVPNKLSFLTTYV